MLFVDCRLLYVGCCLLPVIVVSWLLCIVCKVWFVVCCWRLGVDACRLLCLLFVVVGDVLPLVIVRCFLCAVHCILAVARWHCCLLRVV